MVFGLIVGWIVLALLLRLGARWLWGGVALLWLAATLATALLPEGHPLSMRIGGHWRAWALPLVLGGFVLLYRAALGHVRRRVDLAETSRKIAANSAVSAIAPPVVAGQGGSLAPPELELYARHIVLREIGGTGQKRLKAAHVLVVGAGGLGSPVLFYLAAAGIGRITIIDDDMVSRSNLQRQIIHTGASVGRAKVASAAGALRDLNPFVTVETRQERLDGVNGPALMAEADLILDGSDNFDTRFLVNRLAVAAGKPLVSAAISQWEGQIGLFDPAGGGPCYECLFPARPAPGMAPSCAEAGVVSPLPGVLGSMMAIEAIKYVTKAGETLRGRLLIYDGLYGEARIISHRARADCPVCKGKGLAAA